MIANVTIETSHLFASRLPTGSGYTWTLASRLGHIIRTAESLYGPRNPDFTLLGVEIHGDIPQVWYPGDCGHVVVQITTSCATDALRAAYQMAHEAIHLLSPSGQRSTNVLEEGLATHFSTRYMREHLAAPAWRADVSSYLRAESLVEDLLNRDPDIIRRLRHLRRTFPAMTSADIATELPSVPADLALELTRPFER